MILQKRDLQPPVPSKQMCLPHHGSFVPQRRSQCFSKATSLSHSDVAAWSQSLVTGSRASKLSCEPGCRLHESSKMLSGFLYFDVESFEI